MDLASVITYFNRLMLNYHIQTLCFAPGEPLEFDKGLRATLGYSDAFSPLAIERIEDRVIYRIQDIFSCRYYFLRLPSDNRILMAGPYLSGVSIDRIISNWTTRHGLSTAEAATLRRFLNNLPIMDDDTILAVIMTSLGEVLWDGPEHFRIEIIEPSDAQQSPPSSVSQPHTTRDHLDIQSLELRYEGESRLMHAVSQGMVHQASLMFSSFHPQSLEKRSVDSLRNLKNYAIVLNTLLRKAAQQGNVHPLYIDQLSSTVAHHIEQLHSIHEAQQYLQTMVHKYCLLVKNHTMRGYSQPVQAVILRVDADLTANLALQAHASFLGVNASYLSSLFKRETGMTLTEYVNRKRIDNAIFLLNTTDLQIQVIAQNCGIPDVNYFTKTFKRIIGQTPSEYRQLTRGITHE